MIGRLALIIGNSCYEDAGLSRLAAPDVDVRALAAVLRDPQVGQFNEVVELRNEPSFVVRKTIAKFFAQRKRDDLLLLYFSGHGVRDEQGHLYLALKDTERSLLTGTAIEAAFITAQMDRSHSKRQVLMLDCCHSGAFSHGAKAALGASVGTAAAFEGTGYGRVVLTATDSTQFAWEGDRVIGETENSLFTHFLIQGLKTGEADRDADGTITIDELYDYVYERVVTATPKQTPGRSVYRGQGEIVIAQNARPTAGPAALPSDLLEALESRFSGARLAAIPELEKMLCGRHAGLAIAAREALKRLATDDDSRQVSKAAARILAENPPKVPAPETATEANPSETASAAVPEAPKPDPASERARLLLEEQAAALAQKAEDERHEAEQSRLAHETVEHAQRQFEAGECEAALTRLREFAPAHAVVSRALEELTGKAAKIQQEAADAEHNRLAHELVDEARRLFDAGEHGEALRILREFSPPHALVSGAFRALRRQEQREEIAAAIQFSTAWVGAQVTGLGRVTTTGFQLLLKNRMPLGLAGLILAGTLSLNFRPPAPSLIPSTPSVSTPSSLADPPMAVREPNPSDSTVTSPAVTPPAVTPPAVAPSAVTPRLSHRKRHGRPRSMSSVQRFSSALSRSWPPGPVEIDRRLKPFRQGATPRGKARVRMTSNARGSRRICRRRWRSEKARLLREQRDAAEAKDATAAIGQIEALLAAGELDRAERALTGAQQNFPAHAELKPLGERLAALRRAGQLAKEEQGIRQALREYEAAYESLDAAAVLRVQPSFTTKQADQLAKAFSEYRSYNLTIEDVQISLQGQRATVSTRVTRGLTPKVGRAQTVTGATIFLLEKRGTVWQIVGVQ